MAGVYRWMFAGLVVTAGVALYTASSLAVLQFVYNLRWVFYLATFALVVVLSALAHRLSGFVAGVLFLAYAALTGLIFSFIFVVYELGSVWQAFLLTGGAFLALSIYGTVTKRNLDAWSTFLVMGLIGVVLAGLVQLFWTSPGFSFVVSCACVVVFAGLTAWDTQKLRTWAAMTAMEGREGTAALPVAGALVLYLDFVNLFLALLRLFGRRR
ncbi:MAG: Bax inhibitor-1/YccA family protein [Myxococcaceae bacterium]|nr:Bax inhibitor-1/YccA family protein [Myxococcaceae bacterium]